MSHAPKAVPPRNFEKCRLNPLGCRWLGSHSENTGVGRGGADDTRSIGRSLPAGAAQQLLQAGKRRAAVGPKPVGSRLHGGHGRRLVPRADPRWPARHSHRGGEVGVALAPHPAGHRRSPFQNPWDASGWEAKTRQNSQRWKAAAEATPSGPGGGALVTRPKFRKWRGEA